MPVRVEIPPHLRLHAQIPGDELSLHIPEPVTLSAVICALEAAVPTLRGTVLDPVTGQRRPFLRFFACQQDISLLPLDAPLPSPVVEGLEPLLIIAGIAGGSH